MHDACRALSRQGNFCARPKDHDGCHEAFIDGDGRRWYGDIRDYAEDLASLLRFADLHSNETSE